jgi:hypothetical protein
MGVLVLRYPSSVRRHVAEPPSSHIFTLSFIDSPCIETQSCKEDGFQLVVSQPWSSNMLLFQNGNTAADIPAENVTSNKRVVTKIG